MKKILFILFSLPATFGLIAQQTMGLFLNDTASVNGYTLFTNNRTAYLIDNCGAVVNTWTSNWLSNTGIYLLPNGNLLRSCRIPGDFSGGGIAGRIELFSWGGELLWGYNYASSTYHQHHDIEPLPNGNILVLAWEAKSTAEAIEAGRAPNLAGNLGVWPEHIVELEMVGTDEANIVWEWHLWDHLVQEHDPAKANFGVVADHPELLDINFGPSGAFPNPSPDWIHANAIAYNPDLDQIAISSRNLNEIWIIDHSTTSEEAAGHTGGRWGKGGDLLYRWGNPQAYGRGTDANQTLWGQHNITWILADDHPNFGKLLVFNNGFGRPGGNASSVDFWSPPTDAQGNYLLEGAVAFGPAMAEWSYLASGFYSANISGAHALPGGGYFVCEGTEGRFFEITADGEIVWEYINPVSIQNGPQTQGQNPLQNSTFRATRYPADSPAFEGKNLTPGDPIELNPFPTDCQLFSSVSIFPIEDLSVSIFPNPVEETLQITNETGRPVTVQVFDLIGKEMARFQSDNPRFSIPAYNWPHGVYFVRLVFDNGQNYISQKIVKS